MQGRGWGRVVVVVAALLAALVVPGMAGAEPSSVVGQWRFDETGGQTAVDDGPYALDGRLGLIDGVDARDPERIPGLSGNALRFGGQSFVRLPSAPQLAPPTLTLEAVVRAEQSPGAFRYVVSHGAQGCLAGSYGLYTSKDGGIAFYIFDGKSYYLTAAAAPGDVWNGGWHHVAGVYDGDTLRLYVDGRPVGAAFPASHPIAYSLTSDDHYFGIYQGTCTLPLTGDVDLVRMWLGPLAPTKIGVLSDAALTPRDHGDGGGGTTTTTPPPTVPTADQTDSDAGAPAMRPELKPIAPGTVIAAPAAATAGTAPRTTPGAPARACQVKPSVKKIRVHRPTRLTVRVALRGSPLKGARVVAISSRHGRLASARTAANGRARLKIKTSKRGIFRVKVVGRSDCGSASVSVVH